MHQMDVPMDYMGHNAGMLYQNTGRSWKTLPSWKTVLLTIYDTYWFINYNPLYSSIHRKKFDSRIKHTHALETHTDIRTQATAEVSIV